MGKAAQGFASTVRIAIFLIFLGISTSSCETVRVFFGLESGDPAAIGEIPRSPTTIVSGSQFLRSTNGLSAAARDQAIYQQLKMGNIPSFLKKLGIVNLSAKSKSGKWHRGSIWVMPDYLAVGNDQDFVRMPMTPMVAQRIADQYGYVLPTRKMVNEIYRNAFIKLSPSPMPPGAAMVSNDYYRRHQNTIERQLGARNHGKLVAGHKKDIVITNELRALPQRVAIYGWHRTNGVPIQPLSLVHGKEYADYSHGVRLVRKIMVVNGKNMAVRDVLRDSELNVLLSDEGPIAESRLAMSH